MTIEDLYNCNPSTTLRGKFLIEAMSRIQPYYSKLRVFGCNSFPCLKTYRHSKLDGKSANIFVGYPTHHDGYLCLDPISRKVFISSDVKFIESNFSLNSILNRDWDDIVPITSFSTIGPNLVLIDSVNNPITKVSNLYDLGSPLELEQI